MEDLASKFDVTSDAHVVASINAAVEDLASKFDVTSDAHIVASINAALELRRYAAQDAGRILRLVQEG